MKKLILLLAAVLCLLAGCAKEAEPEPVTMIGNPWKDFASLAEAEEMIGVSLDLPETVAGSYEAETFRTMKGAAELLEVTYRDEDCTVTVRKSPGEGQDIAGVYGFEFAEECQRSDGENYIVYHENEEKSESCAMYIALDHDGYSWSLYAPNGFWGDSAEDFLTGIFD